jgi:S-adenosylmethionine uptake transporter
MRAQSASIALPFAVACLGIGLFAGMDALMKALTLAIGAYNASFWRMFVGTIMMGVAFAVRGGRWPAPHVLRLHMVRAIEVALMIVLYFWGLARVPLAEGIALTFIAPLIALYLAAVQLKEQVTARAIWGSAAGFAGVIVIAYSRVHDAPTPDVRWGIAAILAAALFYAHNLILQRQQAQVATPIDIAFFNTALVLACLALFAPIWVQLPPRAEWPLIVVAALIGSISVMLLAWAYARAEAKVLLVVEYTAFIWGALIGYWAFAEPLTVPTLAGTVLIVFGCVIAAWQERTHLPSAELGL